MMYDPQDTETEEYTVDSRGVLFYWNTPAEHISIPKEVTAIGNEAFASLPVSEIFIHDNVTSIGKEAFRNCRDLKKINIPDSVTKIGSNAFYDCNALDLTEYKNGLYLGNEKHPYSVLVKTLKTDTSHQEIYPETKIICSNAFLNCNGLKEITIPSFVKDINVGAFSDCGNLESLSVVQDNPVYKSDGNCIIEKISNTLVAGCATAIIPDYVTAIQNAAFDGCRKLKRISIPDRVQRIDDGAFCGCTELRNITIGSGLIGIGSNALSGCPLSYNKYDNALYIGNNDNPYMILMHIDDGEKPCRIHENTKIIYCYAFYGAYGLTDITIPVQTIGIGEGAFSDCIRLKSVVISKNVREIGEGAFRNCSALESIVLPKLIQKSGSKIFEGCSKIRHIIIGSTADR